VSSRAYLLQQSLATIAGGRQQVFYRIGLTICGLLSIIAGVTLIYPPAGLITAGLIAAGFGLLTDTE